MPPKSAAAAGSVTPNAATGLDGDVTSKIWKWQSARSAARQHGRVARRARHHGESANRARASARTRDGVPKPREGGRFEFGDERERRRAEQRDAAARAADGDDARVPTAATAVGPSRGASAAETSTASTWVASMEERKVASGRSDVGGGTRTRRATPATSTATTMAGAPGSAAAGSTTHAIGRRTSGKTTRTARAGGAPTPPVGVSARWIAAPSSAVMAQVRRRRRPAFGASRADARAECRAAGGVRGAGRARALARAVHEDDARRGVLLEEHLGEATHGGVGVRTRSARAGSRRGCSLEDGTRGGGRSDARAPGRNLHAAKDARG